MLLRMNKVVYCVPKKGRDLQLEQKSSLKRSPIWSSAWIDQLTLLWCGAMKRLRSPEKTTPNPGRPGGRFSLRGWTSGDVITRMYVSFCTVLLEIF